MPKYVSRSDILAELPTTRPNDPDGNQYSEGDWNTILDNLIAKMSQYIDDNVGTRYSFSYNSNTQKFPEIDDSPATPATIEEICSLLVMAKALRYYGANYNSKDNELIAGKLEEAENKLQKIRTGEIQLSIDGTNLATVPVHSENDYTDDQTEPVFNPDELDIY